MERQIAAIKIILLLLFLLPAAYLGLGLWQDTLGDNPVDAFTRGLGDWALRLLLITLTITPLRRLTRWNWLMRLRRMLGLLAFFYVCLHLVAYLWLDQSFGWTAIGKDILDRPFIVAGMIVFALLVPLAATSTHTMVRRLGGKRWQQLHRWVYPAAMVAVVHFTWMVKADASQPALYGMLLALLLGLRAWWYVQDARKPLLEQRRRIIPIQVRR